ncbi:MAG TPA: amino acid adenylation domain-containing protein [Candidatus Kapabacteria bacterium]|nr:amino acid adenylation domain-containing protein [Candidatus Kapabacteria bacterium]
MDKSTGFASFAMPPDCQTFVTLLRWRAANQPDRIAYTFLERGESEGASITYAGLDLRARAIAAELQQRGLEGSRALLVFPTGIEFLAAFFGCLYANVVAVPTSLPLYRSPWQFENVMNDVRAITAITSGHLMAQVRRAMSRIAPEHTPEWIDVDTIAADLANNWVDPDTAPQALAMLQYTSGSTATPRGVMITHRNLIANSGMISEAFDQNADSTVVGWMPLFHDMGLVGNVLQPMYVGARGILMAPSAFLERPVRWLRAIMEYRAQTSGGPDFAYRMCLNRVHPDQCAGLDLSDWTVAFTGAEPVRAETIERFSDAFRPFGFRRVAFYPCYGLAEATLFVAGGTKSLPPTIRSYDAMALADNRARPVQASDPDAVPLVGCGRGVAGCSVAIVDPETERRCAAERVGEIWVVGDNVGVGLWNREAESASRFRAVLDGKAVEGGYLRTGDLGFLSDGELFITGRLKELIVIRGKNYYPHDIEHTIERTTPGGAGHIAAFTIEIDGEEQLVVALEVKRLPDDWERVVDSIRTAIAHDHLIEVYGVLFVHPGQISITTSGKIRRHMLRDAFLNGRLEILEGSYRLSRADDQPVECAEPAHLLNIPEEQRRAEVTDFFRRQIAVLKHVPAEWIDVDATIDAIGCDSLMTIQLQHAVEQRLGAVISLMDLLEDVSLRALAATVAARLTAGSRAGGKRDAAVAAPNVMSQGERAVWFMHHQMPNRSLHNLCFAVRFGDNTDHRLLLDLVRSIPQRHQALRTLYGVRQEEFIRQVQESVPIAIGSTDADGWSDADLDAAIAGEGERPFDLTADLPLRVHLFRRPVGENVLVMTFHHIAADLWSLVLVATQLASLYRAGRELKEQGLPSADLSGVRADDELRSVFAMPAPEEMEMHWEYWKHVLNPLPERMQLPTDRERPPLPTFRGGIETFGLSSSVSRDLAALAASRHTTLYVVLLAALKAFLARLTGQTDIVVGSPTTGRSRADSADVVGYFVNPIALRTEVSADLSFIQLLDNVHRIVRAGREHQEIPFLMLVERLHPTWKGHRHPLFEVAFVWQQVPADLSSSFAELALEGSGARVDVGELMIERPAAMQPSTMYDLELTMTRSGSTLKGVLKYSADLFEAVSARRMIVRFAHFLESIAASPNELVSRLPLLDEEERALIRLNSRGASHGVPCSTLHGLFEEQAALRPDASALTDGAASVSYGELDERSNRLAHTLMSIGVAPATPVALLLNDRVENIVALLAVLKAGGIFVALDAGHPAAWNRHIVRDVEARYMIADTAALRCFGEPAAANLNSCLVLDLEESTEARRLFGDGSLGRDRMASSGSMSAGLELPPDAPAYIAYTSGSTGRPKGIVHTHANLVQFVDWQRRAFAIDGSKRMAQFAAITFDVAYCEIFGALCFGATLCLADGDVRLDRDRFLAWLQRERISVLQAVPSVLRRMFEELDPAAMPADLESILSVGEVLPVTFAASFTERFPDGPRLYNVYGPTESVAATMYPVERLRPGQKSVPIGMPIDGREILILDRQGELYPIGVEGEIHIRSRYLALGYHGQLEETRARFLHSLPADDSNIPVYRTGDIGRWLHDGTIEFRGRRDNQLKLRGVRIQLEQIEHVAAAQEGVVDCIAVLREVAPADERLVLCVEAAPVLDRTALRRALRAALPAAMLPSIIQRVDRLPRLPNGKIDRHRLPPVVADDVAEGSGAPPLTPVETAVADLWRALLEIEYVGRHDHFFDLGGHSLLAAQAVNRVRQHFGVDLRLSDFLKEPTVEHLSRLVMNEVERVREAEEEIVGMLEEIERASPSDIEALLGRTGKGSAADGPTGAGFAERSTHDDGDES